MSNKKEPWGEGTPWKNSTAFFTYLRGCLRRAWSSNPVKHNLIKKHREQIPNPNPRGKKDTVWGFTCVMCNDKFPLSMCNVDHIVPAGSLQKTEDIQGFVERLLYVTEQDLRLVCKKCNNTLALAERLNISFEEAKLECLVLDTLKDKRKTLDILAQHGYSGDAVSNQEKRRKLLRELLNKEN